MSRRIFISHTGEDRLQVRGFILLRWNINVDFTFFDRSLIDPVKSDDPNYIKKCIRDKMNGTSVTVVLIGSNTYKSKWVRWEIEESVDRGNGILGIKLKGKSAARAPAALKEWGAKVINWEPSIFQNAFERAAQEAGR